MTTTTQDRPSAAQAHFLTDLVRKREAKPGQSATDALIELTRWLAKPTATRREASAMIDRLLSSPLREDGPAPAPAARPAYPATPDSVPSAKFAVETELLSTVPDGWRKQGYVFFEVKKLRGRRVIRRLVGAPGRFTRTFVPGDLASELFGHLEREEFAFAASKKFGEIYQVCGRCGAELTDDQSRDRKFGPVCWDLMKAWRPAG